MWQDSLKPALRRWMVGTLMARNNFFALRKY